MIPGRNRQERMFLISFFSHMHYLSIQSLTGIGNNYAKWTVGQNNGNINWWEVVHAT